MGCLLAVLVGLNWIWVGVFVSLSRWPALLVSSSTWTLSPIAHLELVRLAFGAPGRGSRVAVHWVGAWVWTWGTGHGHTQLRRSVDFQSSTTQISTGSHFQAAASLPHPQPSSSFPFHLRNPGILSILIFFFPTHPPSRFSLASLNSIVSPTSNPPLQFRLTQGPLLDHARHIDYRIPLPRPTSAQNNKLPLDPRQLICSAA